MQLQSNQISPVYAAAGLGSLAGNIASILALEHAALTSPEISPLKAKLIGSVESLRKGIPIIKTVERIPEPIASHYNYLRRAIKYRSAPIYFHELGHHLLKNKALRAITLASRLLSGPFALYMGYKFGRTGEAKYPLIYGLLTSPYLAEEILAHMRGYGVARRWASHPLGKLLMRKIPVKGRVFGRVAVPAVASYVTSTLFPFFVSAAASDVIESLLNRINI